MHSGGIVITPEALAQATRGFMPVQMTPIKRRVETLNRCVRMFLHIVPCPHEERAYSCWIRDRGSTSTLLLTMLADPMVMLPFPMQSNSGWAINGRGQRRGV